MSSALLDYIKSNYSRLRAQAIKILTDSNTLLNANGKTYLTILEDGSQCGELSKYWALNECLKDNDFDLWELN